MVEALDDACGERIDCPLCRDDLADDLVSIILSARPGDRMTADECSSWLSDHAASAR